MISGNGKNGKVTLDSLTIPLIIVLVAIASFGLGRLSALKEGKSGLVIHPAPLDGAQ